MLSNYLSITVFLVIHSEPPSVSAGDAKKEMSISTILVIGCSIFGVLAFLGVSFMVVCRSRQMTTNQYRRQTEETGRLGLREINDPGLSPDSNDRLPQEFEGAQLSGNNIVSYKEIAFECGSFESL